MTKVLGGGVGVSNKNIQTAARLGSKNNNFEFDYMVTALQEFKLSYFKWVWAHNSKPQILSYCFCSSLNWD